MFRLRLERRRGAVRLHLPERDRNLLATLAGQLDERLAGETADADLRRLFPPGYDQRPADEVAYRELMGTELLDGKRRALTTFLATLGQQRLSENELDVWLRVLNDMRLVLGTRLDVQEDTFVRELDRNDPHAPELALYSYLSWLQEQAVAAAVPERGTKAGEST